VTERARDRRWRDSETLLQVVKPRGVSLRARWRAAGDSPGHRARALGGAEIEIGMRWEMRIDFEQTRFSTTDWRFGGRLESFGAPLRIATHVTIGCRQLLLRRKNLSE
jgi:hypothetical protein